MKTTKEHREKEVHLLTDIPMELEWKEGATLTTIENDVKSAIKVMGLPLSHYYYAMALVINSTEWELMDYGERSIDNISISIPKKGF